MKIIELDYFGKKNYINADAFVCVRAHFKKNKTYESCVLIDGTWLNFSTTVDAILSILAANKIKVIQLTFDGMPVYVNVNSIYCVTPRVNDHIERNKSKTLVCQDKWLDWEETMEEVMDKILGDDISVGV